MNQVELITHEMIVLFIFGMLGLIVHYLIKWQEAKDQKRKFTLKGKLPSVLIVIVCLMVLTMLGDEIKDFFVPGKFNMFFMGYGGHSMILKMFDKKAPVQ
jgi:hypothetical protein